MYSGEKTVEELKREWTKTKKEEIGVMYVNKLIAMNEYELAKKVTLELKKYTKNKIDIYTTLGKIELYMGNIKEAKYYGIEYANTIGTAYGYIVNRYQHTKNLIETIKNNPNDRRMVKSLWQDEFLRTAVLPSCVWSTEWDVTKNKINLMVHQRSCDVPLGLPFNITQYATLLKMIAQVTDKEPGTITYSIKDAHVYVNQLKGIKKQLERLEKYNSFSKLNDNYLESLKETLLEQQKLFDKNSEEYKELDSNIRIIDMILNPTKPELILNPSIKDFFEFDNSKDLKDIKVKNYKHMGTIKFPVAQ